MSQRERARHSHPHAHTQTHSPALPACTPPPARAHTRAPGHTHAQRSHAQIREGAWLAAEAARGRRWRKPSGRRRPGTPGSAHRPRRARRRGSPQWRPAELQEPGPPPSAPPSAATSTAAETGGIRGPLVGGAETAKAGQRAPRRGPEGRRAGREPRKPGGRAQRPSGAGSPCARRAGPPGLRRCGRGRCCRLTCGARRAAFSPPPAGRKPAAPAPRWWVGAGRIAPTQPRSQPRVPHPGEGPVKNEPREHAHTDLDFP